MLDGGLVIVHCCNAQYITHTQLRHVQAEQHRLMRRARVKVKFSSILVSPVKGTAACKAQLSEITYHVTNVNNRQQNSVHLLAKSWRTSHDYN